MNNLQEILDQNSNALIEKEDLRELLLEVEKINPKVILEIGTRQGFSFRAFIDAFTPELAITVDILKKEDIPAQEMIPIIGTPGIHYLWDHDSTSEKCVQDVDNLLGDRRVDFLFIDGDHMLETVTKDFDNYSLFVRKGGIIALHDVSVIREDINVTPLWEELKQEYEHKLIKTSLQSTGIGILFA